MNSVIFVFGPSCSGKSTLGQALQKHLGREWVYIDRDDLDESTADTILEERIQSIKTKIIIDAQIPWREKREGEYYFMILPSLDVLLARDALRTERLGRSVERAKRAYNYVVETYDVLSKMDKQVFDYCFNSSMLSVKDEVEIVASLINHSSGLAFKKDL